MSRNPSRQALVVGVAGLLMALTLAVRPAGAVCLGDCDNDGQAAVNDLMRMISIIIFCDGAAAGCDAISGADKQCLNADPNGSSTITVGELVRVVSNIINLPNGCPPDTSSPTPTVTIGLPTGLPTATRTQTSPPTSTPPAATPTPTATATTGGAGLGDRSFSLGSASGFFSSLAVGKVGTPEGTLLLRAGPMNASGQATVTLANAPVVVRTDLPLGGLTLCTRLESCTGTLYCNGGVNADVLNSLDSLKPGLTCVRDGTNLCSTPPAPTPTACCSNACEGVGVGSGNTMVQTSPPPVPTPGKDNGPGALLLICQQRSAPREPIGDCSGADLDGAGEATQYYTTGINTSQVLNHCAGSGAPPNRIPRLARVGTNFDCGNWTMENGPGVIAFTIPSEEGSSAITGDGANAGLWSDRDQ